MGEGRGEDEGPQTKPVDCFLQAPKHEKEKTERGGVRERTSATMQERGGKEKKLPETITERERGEEENELLF